MEAKRRLRIVVVRTAATGATIVSVATALLVGGTQSQAAAHFSAVGASPSVDVSRAYYDM
jgi:hypothetical protein